VEQCFCTECSTYDNLQNCVHRETVEARPEDDDDLMVPIDTTDDSGSFFFVIYASSNLCEKGLCYISRTQTLTSTFVSLSYI
jgi:hypothetical protein